MERLSMIKTNNFGMKPIEAQVTLRLGTVFESCIWSNPQHDYQYILSQSILSGIPQQTSRY